MRWSAGWSDSATLDMLSEMTSLATAIAGRTMFHWDVASTVARGIGSALTDAMSLFSRASIPFAELLLKLPLPSTRRFYRAKARLDAVIYGLIAERRHETGDGDRGDLLSMLLLDCILPTGTAVLVSGRSSRQTAGSFLRFYSLPLLSTAGDGCMLRKIAYRGLSSARPMPALAVRAWR